MIHGLAWIAGKDNASGAELGRSIGDEGYFLLVRDAQNRSAGILQRADNADDVIDREHIDARRRLIEDCQLGFHREDGRKLDPMAFTAAQRLVQATCQVAVRIEPHLFECRFGIGFRIA